MKPFVLGVLVGVIAGVTLTLLFLDRPAVEKLTASPTMVAHQSVDRAPNRAARELSNTVPVHSPPKVGVLDMPAKTPSSDVPKAQEANSSTSDVRSNLSPPHPANTNPTSPIRVTEAHQQLLDSSTRTENGMTLAQRHNALEAEDLDSEWSYYMEDQLNRFFASHAPPLRVDIANITCRATACEVQAFEDGEPQAIISLIKAAGKEPWWDFSGAQASSDDYQGRERALVFLERKFATQTTPVQTKNMNPKIADRK